MHKPIWWAPDVSEIINEQSVLGTNATISETKCWEARQLIDAAHARPSIQDFLVSSYLSAAQKAIREWGLALDRAWAEKTVSDARQQNNKTDAMIVVCTGNQSMADDIQLAPTIVKRDQDMGNLTAANNNITDENFALARGRAQNAFRNANESYTDL